MNQDIKNAKLALENQGVICYPTDTIWGLGCDATSNKAIERLFEIKKRKAEKSMLILLSDIGRVASYIEEVPDIAYDLFETAESPLTLILPSAKNLSPKIIADDGTIGIRIIKHEWCEKLLRQFKKPIVSTSANISGQFTPATFDEIANEIISKVDYVAQFGHDNTTKTKPSSIIKVSISGIIEIIRN